MLRYFTQRTTQRFHSTTTPRCIRAFSVAPHGPTGQLVNGLLTPESEEIDYYWNLAGLPEIHLTKRQLCDIEMLLNGAFTPLQGFMNQAEYTRVVNEMRLPDGTLWPMPVTLDISEAEAKLIDSTKADKIILRDPEFNPVAVMDIDDLWRPDKDAEGQLVFGGDPEHPAIEYLRFQTGPFYIGGKLHGFQLPPRYDYTDLRLTPAETRARFASRGWDKVVAFQTRNPMHRAHIELTKRALSMDPDLKLLIHPVVGMTKPGDIDHHTRVKCYKAVLPYYDPARTDLVVMPLAMRMGGPREAIWHAIIRKNYGCTHFILGRDHAGPGANSQGKDFYGPYDARDAAVEVEPELGIKCMAFEMMLYAPDHDTYYPQDAVPQGVKTLKLSGTEVRRRLRTGEDIPEWFSYPDVVSKLRIAHPQRTKQGFCVFFTGLSGSGKSTIAYALQERLMEIQSRNVAMLDGDHVRKLISSELSFSKDHRNLNIKRIGFIASLIVQAGGLVIAAPIAPYHESRKFSRDCISDAGGYCQVFVNTPLEVCMDRDRKGLYRRAIQGQLKGLTGVDDPYETPEDSDVVINSADVSVQEAVDMVVDWLRKEGYVEQPPADALKAF